MNANVTIIPPRKIAGNTVDKHKDKPKLRVVAYCRVSTDSEEQATSYDIIRIIFQEILSGSLPAFTLMTVFQEPARKNVSVSTT